MKRVPRMTSPSTTTVISRENYQELLWPLPITSLLFVGRSAAAALEHYGVHTIGDLARLDREAAASILGRQGCTLHDYATGAEHSPVVPAREQPGPKSVGNGLTFPRNLVGWAELHAGVTELADEVAVRLRGHGLKCTTLQVTIRDPNFKDICRQKRLSAPTYVARELTETAMELIRAAWRENAPVRALTLTAQALVDSALGHVRLLNDCNFDDICISVKCSHVPVNMAAYRMLHEQTHYPLHLGVTEAGTPRLGVLKSAIGIGGLLCQGIGDTLRVSLTADPEEEVRAALDILSAAGLRKTGPDLISCPTCGRTRYDMIPIAREVERRLQGCTKPITVAVMGCVVNGPGEARAADVGIAGGDGEGLLFRHGEILRKVPQDKLVDALMDEIDKL